MPQMGPMYWIIILLLWWWPPLYMMLTNVHFKANKKTSNQAILTKSMKKMNW